ncbi:hypothetical protein BHU72_01545 [Desulfuribacillus stibiiarsenatis]|uniref:Uncharacterized protein n=1 Tax=Desulfuribacillus stibiiarsenatis TaxID=1390249 RepID=A0A1E5LA69_9FIRM|nr:hypothetical protein [Desulfuribacillus stibiiarsenatis]OEH86968.1 hypothetical protein BHU72_01545 [Desulfuribacillus stibiiarsenatis]
MKINLIIFVSSKEEKHIYEVFMKTFESAIRPNIGDIIDDPGFDPKFHNGYEVVKVTISYANDECWVSLAPMVIELQDIEVASYMEKLVSNGWVIVSRDELAK